MVYNFLYYHPELQGQFAGICRYTDSIIFFCIHLTKGCVQIALHLRHQFDRNHHIPKPNKIPTHAFKNSNISPLFCSREDLKHIQLGICFPKTPQAWKTFLVFDCLHLCIYKEQQWGGIMPSCCPCELQFYYFTVLFFLYIKSRQHRKWQCKAPSELSYHYSLTGRGVQGVRRRLIPSCNWAKSKASEPSWVLAIW